MGTRLGHARRAALKGALAAAIGLGACASASSFSRTLPAGVPALEGWEKSTGRAELDDPHRIVSYEFFVRPGREATYEVIRYRISYTDPLVRARLDYTSNERLQWDLDGRRLRRFELVPQGEVERWEELAADSQRFQRETGVILRVLGLHRQLLQLRDGRAP